MSGRISGALGSLVDCMNEPSVTVNPCGKRARWSSLGRRLTDLARVAVCQTPRGNVNPESRQPVTQLLYRGLPYMAGTDKPSVLGHVLLCVSEVSFFFCQRAGNGGHA